MVLEFSSLYFPRFFFHNGRFQASVAYKKSCISRYSIENLNQSKKHLIQSLFIGNIHLNLKFTANMNIFQNKKSYVKP